MKKKNNDIRIAILVAGLKQYEVAKEMGISEEYFSKMLRNDLTNEKKMEILTAIDRIRPVGTDWRAE